MPCPRETGFVLTNDYGKTAIDLPDSGSAPALSELLGLPPALANDAG